MVAKTILIADGGSTKTDWSIVSGNREIDRIRTGGINPCLLYTSDAADDV